MSTCSSAAGFITVAAGATSVVGAAPVAEMTAPALVASTLVAVLTALVFSGTGMGGNNFSDSGLRVNSTRTQTTMMRIDFRSMKNQARAMVEATVPSGAFRRIRAIANGNNLGAPASRGRASPTQAAGETPALPGTGSGPQPPHG